MIFEVCEKGSCIFVGLKIAMEYHFCQKKSGRRPEKREKIQKKIAEISMSLHHSNLHSHHQMEMSQMSSEMNPETAIGTEDVARAE